MWPSRRSIAMLLYITPAWNGLLFLEHTSPIHHQSHLANDLQHLLPSKNISTLYHPLPPSTTMVLRPAAREITPVPGSSSIHTNDWPLRDPQRDLELGLSHVQANDWPLQRPQADLEAGRAYQETTHSPPATSIQPPTYFSFVSSHVEPSAQTQRYAPRPTTTSNDNAEDVELGRPRGEPESAERQRDRIRPMIRSVVNELLAAENQNEEYSEEFKYFVLKVVAFVLIFCIVFFGA